MPPRRLENDFGAELKNSWIESFSGLAEDRRARVSPIGLKRESQIVIREEEIDVVERIECVGTELQYSVLAQAEASTERQVCRDLAGAAIRVPAQCAVRSEHGLRKDSWTVESFDKILLFERRLDRAFGRGIRAVIESASDTTATIQVVVATHIDQIS